MIGWIVYYRNASLYNKLYIDFYIEEGIKLGIDVKLVLVEDLEFGVKNNRWFMKYRKEAVVAPDFVICRVIYPLLSKQFEYMGIPIFNNSLISEICNDKARTYQHLAKTGIPIIDSSFFRNFQISNVFSDVKKPTVIKSAVGHGGSQVFLVEPSDVVNYEMGSEADEDAMNFSTRKNRNDIINKLKHSDVVVQPLIGSNQRELRVFVIGKEIIAGVLRTTKGGDKPNFSVEVDVSKYQLSEEETALVMIIIDQFDFGLVGIDFVLGDNGELIFNEIEDVVGSRRLYQCYDINIVKLYLEFIKRKIISL